MYIHGAMNHSRTSNIAWFGAQSFLHSQRSSGPYARAVVWVACALAVMWLGFVGLRFAV